MNRQMIPAGFAETTHEAAMVEAHNTQAAGAATLTDEQIIEAVRHLATDGGRWPSDWIAAVRIGVALASTATAPSAPDSAAPSSLSAEVASEGRDEDDQYTLDRAADLLEHYLAYVKDVKPDDIERHPHIPEMEQVAADLRKFAATPPAQAPAIQAPEAVSRQNSIDAIWMYAQLYADEHAASIDPSRTFAAIEGAKRRKLQHEVALRQAARELAEEVATPSAAVSAGPAAGYFLRAGYSPANDGTKLWEQVADEHKDDADVVPLYERAPTQPQQGTP